MPSQPSRPTLANVNGELQPLVDVRISVLDRGFLFGDAVYEVLRVYGGKPWLEAEHFQRLERSLAAIQIVGVDLVRLRRRMSETITASGIGEATVYVQITRGVAPRTHAFPASATPFELLWVAEFTDPYREQRHLGAAAITYRDLRWRRCDIKSTNLLGNVLAMQAAKEAGCQEALLYGPAGEVLEGSHTSLFGVRDGVLLTAPNSEAILPGCTRGLVLRLAGKADIPVRERAILRDEFDRLGELFLAGTTSEVLPITKVDGRTIGSGQPGDVTRRLQKAYAEAVQAFLRK